MVSPFKLVDGRACVPSSSIAFAKQNAGNIKITKISLFNE